MRSNSYELLNTTTYEPFCSLLCKHVRLGIKCVKHSVHQLTLLLAYLPHQGVIFIASALLLLQSLLMVM